MFERFAPSARETVTSAVKEAQMRGDRRIGTDHLFIGMLHDQEIIDTLGVTLQRARDVDADFDSTALRAIGLNLSGAASTWSTPPKMSRTPFSTGAKNVMKSALATAVASHSRTINVHQIAVALLSLKAPDPAAALAVGLGIDPTEAIAKLTRSEAA
ncbi:Clp protease N-terminal domain-containing protein [Arthrobacter sp. H35-D1]|uniref:Clp protease N-terminal domain-containing protein n=1 Tax=Arthrobacter sp. H35-D1 TaxID=3046202 RepID=UPI0024BA7452|nr:Clp protease N-terminal domain-containing protein [Arthrobacter sp. H35-D1]MDJ0313474.1 Clp protease N-terminal domain-containing protein [Arthrobacter sp. H35-D1]